jgi:hypothetical protein
MRKLGRLVVLAISLASTNGCAPLRVQTPPLIVRGVPYDEAVTNPARAKAIATKNQESIEYFKKVEWPLQLDSTHRPQLAVALSGGGLRSAVFSLGVLSGLHEAGIFPENTDLLSAVSGGGYIQSWFYAQQILHGYTADELLSPTGKPQRFLQEHADFVELKPRQPGSILALLASVGPMSVANLLANGIFGWHLNTSTTSHRYMVRFRRTFFGPTTRAKLTVTWSQVRQLLQMKNSGDHSSHHLPMPILNATADLGYTSKEIAHRGYNAVYEFTPYRFGSEGMGYNCYDEKKHLSEDLICPRSPEIGSLERIAVTSGAAYDSSHIDSVAPGRVERLVASSLNPDLLTYPGSKMSG